MNTASQAHQRLAEAAEISGDFVGLVEQLGSVPEGGEAGITFLQEGQPTNAADVGALLNRYRTTLLEPVELPAILSAWDHARHGRVRELITLDCEFGKKAQMRPFALASLHAGRNQLRRLRPLRDEKVAQRYLRAIEAGEASGWHTLVYGLTLAIYSLSPREGLLAYASQTLQSFGWRSTRGAAASEATVTSALQKASEFLPEEINRLLKEQGLSNGLKIQP